MNRQLLQWYNQVNAELHGTTHGIPFYRLPQEHLKPLPHIPPYQLPARRAPKNLAGSVRVVVVPEQPVFGALSLRRTGGGPRTPGQPDGRPDRYRWDPYAPGCSQPWSGHLGERALCWSSGGGHAVQRSPQEGIPTALHGGCSTGGT